jgi:hypothetical protein
MKSLPGDGTDSEIPRTYLNDAPLVLLATTKVGGNVGMDTGRTEARRGLVAFTGVLAADQTIKAVTAAGDGVERAFSFDPAVAMSAVAAVVVAAVFLRALAQLGAVSTLVVGLVLGGPVSSVIDRLATGLAGATGLADVAVLTGVGLGLVQSLLHVVPRSSITTG